MYIDSCEKAIRECRALSSNLATHRYYGLYNCMKGGEEEEKEKEGESKEDVSNNLKLIGDVIKSV